MSTNSVIFIKGQPEGTYVHWDGDLVGKNLEAIIVTQGIDYVIKAIEDNNFAGFSCIDPRATEDESKQVASVAPLENQYVVEGLGIGYAEDSAPIMRDVWETGENPFLEYAWEIDPVSGAVTELNQ